MTSNISLYSYGLITSLVKGSGLSVNSASNPSGSVIKYDQTHCSKHQDELKRTRAAYELNTPIWLFISDCSTHTKQSLRAGNPPLVL